MSDNKDEPIQHRGLELRIKRQSLAAESVIIKAYEGSLRDRILKRLAKGRVVTALQDKRQEIHEHRTQAVRPEARAAHLACNFLRRRPYDAVESPETTRTLPDWDRVKTIIQSFSDLGGNAIQVELNEWRQVGDWGGRWAKAGAARVGTRSAKRAAHRPGTKKPEAEAPAA